MYVNARMPVRPCVYVGLCLKAGMCVTLVSSFTCDIAFGHSFLPTVLSELTVKKKKKDKTKKTFHLLKKI